MTNIYDMNAAIRQPNITGALQQGVQFGQQQRALREQRADQQNLRNLAPRVISGDVGAFQEAAAISPEAATGYQQAGDSQLRRLKRFVDYVDKARAQAQQTGDMRFVNAALQQGSGFISNLLGKPGPTEWTPDMEPGWEALKAQIAMADGGNAQQGILSTYIDDQGQRVAVRRDGSTQVLGGADLGASKQTIEIPGPDGRPRQYTFDRRTGNYVPAGSDGGQVQEAQPPQQSPRFTNAAGEVIDVSQVTDPYLRQQIIQNPEGFGLLAESGGGSVELPERTIGTQMGGNQFVGRSPEEQAAATEAAKINTQLQYAPQVAAQEATAAGQRETAVQTARTEAERAAQAPKRIASYQQALTAAGNVMQSIEKAIGLIGPMSTGFLGARFRGVEGSPAYNLAAEIETVRANLGFDRLQQMRDNSPTGGALGQVAVQELIALQSTVANLDPNQSPEQIKANLERVMTHYNNWKSAVEQALAEERGAMASGQRQQVQQSNSDDALIGKYL